MATVRAFSRNIPYLRQQFGALLGNTSTTVKTICVVVLISYLLSFSETAVQLLAVRPGNLLPPTFWLWTAFTFCFLEVHFYEALVDIVTVGLCGKLIEPLWGQLEMLIFFAVVNFGVAILSTVFYLILYMCTFNTDLLFNVQIHGLSGYIAGVCVAVKQIMPDHVLFRSPIGKIKNRNIPLTCGIMALILYLVGLLEGRYPTMFFSGLFVSWIYLRFYQRHNNGSRGDMNDNFCFASFFPNVLQPPIAVISNTIYSALVRIGLCRKVVRRYDMANPTGVTVTLPGIDPHDMERRRQIALKALSERLSRTSDGHQSKDKQPLIPKTNQKILQPIIQPNLQGNVPSSSHHHHHHHHTPNKTGIVTPSPNTAFVPIAPNIVSPEQTPQRLPTSSATNQSTPIPSSSSSVNIDINET